MKIKKFFGLIILSLLLISTSACAAKSNSSVESPTEIKKTEAVLSVENEIDGLPRSNELDISDGEAVFEAEKNFNALSDDEKNTVDNYDVLFAAVERIVLLNNVYTVNSAIAALLKAGEITLGEEDNVEEVTSLYDALGEKGRAEVEGYSKLEECAKRISSLKRIREVNELIARLPNEEEADEGDIALIDEVEEAFYELSEDEKAEVENPMAIGAAREAVTTSFWTDKKLRKHYVIGKDLAFNVNLKGNTAVSLTADGKGLSADDFSYSGGVLTLKESFLKTLDTGMHTFVLTDSRDKIFSFIVGAGYEEKNTAYFDFDVLSYRSPDTVGVPMTIEENGITGRSGRFTKSDEYADVLGFFKGGKFGFVDYTFKTNAVYLLEFDIKILSATSDKWWMPIFFGGKGDVAYLFADYRLLFPEINTLFSEGEIEFKGDHAHIKAVFKATSETADLEFTSWGGGLDVIIDNILLTVLPSDGINAVVGLISALPEDISSSDRQAVENAKTAYEALYLAEKQKVENFSKLESAILSLENIDKASSVVELIDKLPDVNDVSEADYGKITEAKAAYDALGEAAQSYVGNYEKLSSLLQFIGASYWNETDIEFYIKSTDDFSVKVELLDNGISSVTLNGDELSESDYSYNNGVLDLKGTFKGRKRDVYTVVLTDGNGKKFTFFVYLDIKKGSALYFDFDVYAYSNDNGAAVSSYAYDDGISGKSQRFVQSGTATLFGFFKGGAFGFVPYSFVSGKTYTLSFDIKVLDGTASGWWMPIYFNGGKGDLLYVRHNGGEIYLQEYGVDALNSKNRQSVTDNGDGSYRISVTFTLSQSETYDNIEFASWDGAVDILLDNLLLIEE
ncbi:MAG: hypothetical protein IJ706_03135 [Clostridia bacterium]|nr:hypothetical protein [Clostridia bacterium]